MTPGELSDHYDPRDKSVHLSQAVAQSNSVASVAVAAHEVGHAIQHAKGSAFFQFRTALARPGRRSPASSGTCRCWPASSCSSST